MLTEEGCRKRIENLWARVPANVEWLLIGSPDHVQYFCNFRPNPISFSAGQNSLLLLERSGNSTLMAANFTRRTAVSTPFIDNEIIIPWYTHKTSVANRDHALVQALLSCETTWSKSQGLTEREGISELLTEVVAEHSNSLMINPINHSTTTLGEVIRSIRRQKLPDEIALMKSCMRAGEAGHAAAFDTVKVGASELDVYFAVQQAAQKTAGFPCVVYGDFRATNAVQFKAGGLPTEYILQDGDLFIIDYSVVINGYRSDFTNTIAVGQPTDAQLRQFEACRDAMLAAETTLVSGVACKDVYVAASRVFEQHGYPALSHHCGHGLGLEHPEPPILVSESTDELMTGDVITIEPGLYVDGVGGMRFEHNYLVTESGYDRLSNHHIGLTR